MSATDNDDMKLLTQDGMAAVVAAQQVEIAGLTKAVSAMSEKLDTVVEYINIQKGQKQMAALMAGSLGLASGGLGSILVWIGVTMLSKGHP